MPSNFPQVMADQFGAAFPDPVWLIAGSPAVAPIIEATR
jgi:hypothetical protein